MNTSVETNIWGDSLHALTGRLNEQTLEKWFRPIRFEGVDHSAHVIRLRAPNQVVKDWVVSNYSKLLEESLNALRLSGYSVGWAVEKEASSVLVDWNSKAGTDTLSRSLDKESRSMPTTEQAGSGFNPSENSSLSSNLSQLEPSLISKYTYESFVVGSCNQFAHAASMAVAEAPGRTYNPLYLYGGVGLGKTHVIIPAGTVIKARNHHLKLCYISSEKFMNDLINAIRYDKTQSFREKYRSVDVLLIDDVQFMAGQKP